MTDCSKCKYRSNLMYGCATPALSEMYRGHGDMWTCAFFAHKNSQDGDEDVFSSFLSAYTTSSSVSERNFIIPSNIRMDH